MKIRALVSFSGVLNMRKGQEMECDNDVVLQDLFQARYIEKVEEEKPKKDVKPVESKRDSDK